MLFAKAENAPHKSRTDANTVSADASVDAGIAIARNKVTQVFPTTAVAPHKPDPVEEKPPLRIVESVGVGMDDPEHEADIAAARSLTKDVDEYLKTLPNYYSQHEINRALKKGVEAGLEYIDALHAVKEELKSLKAIWFQITQDNSNNIMMALYGGERKIMEITPMLDTGNCRIAPLEGVFTGLGGMRIDPYLISQYMQESAELEKQYIAACEQARSSRSEEEYEKFAEDLLADLRHKLQKKYESTYGPPPVDADDEKDSSE